MKYKVKGNKMNRIEEMKKKKMIDWGNGEPCPFCGKPFDKVDSEHLFKEHEKELKEILF
jgi:DNA repair exonuclease SbcCD ATPase subunit